MLAKTRVPYEPYYSTAPGLAEQKPDLYWDSLCKICQALWKQKGVDKSSIAAVSLTTQRSTVINAVALLADAMRQKRRNPEAACCVEE